MNFFERYFLFRMLPYHSISDTDALRLVDLPKQDTLTSKTEPTGTDLRKENRNGTELASKLKLQADSMF